MHKLALTTSVNVYLLIKAIRNSGSCRMPRCKVRQQKLCTPVRTAHSQCCCYGTRRFIPSTANVCHLMPRHLSYVSSIQFAVSHIIRISTINFNISRSSTPFSRVSKRFFGPFLIFLLRRCMFCSPHLAVRVFDS
jgi:hypothetical protein